ncbi:hypothetical protein M9458_056152 [Cirrhinus mrigala]|uniref:Reverse transcriptase RNase H-like domain-containing protein n=1 Tax=Cirrhinus mrigala TaxID=683832 RepID=A0ABD0MI23_CIRMR
MLRHKHVLVRTDNTATVAYINRQGGLRSRHIQMWLKSLRAVHIPGELNRAADQLSRQPTHPGEWRLHPQTVQLIWSRFGEAQIDLFASPESPHCQLYYSLSEAPLGRDALAHSWPPGPNLLAQTLCKIREDGEQVLLVAPYWPTRTCPSLEDPLEEGPSFTGDGHNLAPASRSVEPACVASGRDTVDLPGLPQAVIETITQQAYALSGEDPQRCLIAVVLSFLQEKLERRLSPSTLKVYAAAIAAHHDAVDGASIGKHQLVMRVNPPRPHLVPSWDLSVTLQGLRGPPFEPLVSVELKFLSLKTALLTALASIKRIGDLQAFSVNEACLEFGPADSNLGPPCPAVRTRCGVVRDCVPTGLRIDVRLSALGVLRNAALGLRPFPWVCYVRNPRSLKEGTETKNLNEWMHAAILYTRMYGGVALRANSPISLAFSIKLRGDWSLKRVPICNVSVPSFRERGLRT